MKKALPILAFLAVAFAPALTGSFFRPGEWYAGLQKPSFTPPGWIFGPAWMLLYLTIGISGYLAWSSPAPRPRAAPFAAYALQLALNALWSVLFFGLHRPGLAMIDLALLWAAILANVLLFWRLRPSSALLLLPYFAWTTFAGLLNFAFWRLNS